jgi:pimeloyl-ACP methyl ester carboxylesterase
MEAPLKLRERGFDESAIGEFQELNGAIHRAALRRFAEGWVDVEVAAAKYRDRPWMKALPEMQTWASMVLGMGIDQAKVAMPGMLQSFIDPFYNSVPTLERLDIPMLWLIAGDDIEAPPGPTIAALARLRSTGKNIQTKVFQGADHGMTEFTRVGTRRTPTRYTPQYASTMVGWIREQVRR